MRGDFHQSIVVSRNWMMLIRTVTFFVPETDQSCRQMSGNGADLLHEANVTAFSP